MDTQKNNQITQEEKEGTENYKTTRKQLTK